MFTRIAMRKSTGNFSEEAEKLRIALDACDAVLVGAGAGMSAASGFSYDGRRFMEHFGDFHEKYGIRDMYTGGFYPFGSPEEYWAWWSRMIMLNRYEAETGKPYSDLLSLLSGKDYFVLTTNVDHQFQKAGFDKSRLFYTQGDYGLWQCSVPCHGCTYDNEAAVRRMAAEEKDMRIPSHLVPRCPVCGKPMEMNLRTDDRFVQDDGWYAASSRYDDFIRRRRGCRILLLELGVGSNTPGIIKYPFWRMAAENHEAVYASISLGESFVPEEIAGRSICIDGDIGKVLEKLKRES